VLGPDEGLLQKEAGLVGSGGEGEVVLLSNHGRMRTTTTLLSIALFTSLQAQAPGDSLHMFFDDASDDLQLDSVYPAGCWQVGVPSKTIFSSAYSPGRALVTDTVAPYPENTTCYAEFTLIASNDQYSGRSILFRQRRDMDLSTIASIEVRTPWTSEWYRFGTGWEDWLYVDGIGQVNDGTGYAFTGTSTGWEEIWMESPCIGVFWNEGQRGMKWYDPVMHVRFVFEGQSNPNAHEGWMIDNVRAGVSLCTGSVDEPIDPVLVLSPNPADQYVEIGLRGGGELKEIEIIAADGRIVHAGRLPSSPVDVLDVSGLMSGPYMLRASTSNGELRGKMLVRH
jgi:hypothetical protein